MIQITPQTRVFVAVDKVNFRKGKTDPIPIWSPFQPLSDSSFQDGLACGIATSLGVGALAISIIAKQSLSYTVAGLR
jgi:hypothetical protein